MFNLRQWRVSILVGTSHGYPNWYTGALGKIPNGGRNWEGFAADPYLTGVAMSNAIRGMQDAGVQACAKHFIGNEQERNRETMSSNIDDRTLHELYLWQSRLVSPLSCVPTTKSMGPGHVRTIN
jgi:beta-glucosidase-like glycosyl hydrolase